MNEISSAASAQVMLEKKVVLGDNNSISLCDDVLRRRW